MRKLLLTFMLSLASLENTRRQSGLSALKREADSVTGTACVASLIALRQYVYNGKCDVDHPQRCEDK